MISFPGGPGLYVITDTKRHRGARLIEAVQASIEGGAGVVQYRNKADLSNYPLTERLAETRELANLCRGAGVCFIVNDDESLAAACGADGVHLGGEDGTASAGSDHRLLYGASCYGSIERAERCFAAGADYLAFGRFFGSSTKPDAPAAEVDVIRQAKQQFDCPVVAIGGISVANGAELVQAGADWLAVVAAVFDHETKSQIRDSAAALSSLFDSSR